jgi:hypothetical protein
LLSFSGINYVLLPLLIKECVIVMECFEMSRWRKMEISRTDHVRTEEVLQRVEEVKNILQTTKIRKAKWIGHILRGYCLLKHVEGKVEGRIEVTERRGRRRKQLLYDFKEKREYCKLKEEALDYTL